MTINTQKLRETARLLSSHRWNCLTPLGVEEVLAAADEIDRLQRIIDSRPAINAGLQQAYIDWSQSIYLMEATCTQETNQ